MPKGMVFPFYFTLSIEVAQGGECIAHGSTIRQMHCCKTGFTPFVKAAGCLHLSDVPGAVLSTATAYIVFGQICSTTPEFELSLGSAQETDACAYRQSDRSSLELTIVAYSSAICHELESVLFIVIIITTTTTNTTITTMIIIIAMMTLIIITIIIIITIVINIIIIIVIIIVIVILLYAGIFDKGVSCDQHGVCARGGPFCIHPGTQLLRQTGRSASPVDFPAARPRLGLLPQKGVQSTVTLLYLHQS